MLWPVGRNFLWACPHLVKAQALLGLQKSTTKADGKYSLDEPMLDPEGLSLKLQSLV